MFKDDYKFAVNKITASEELKRKTIERINSPKKFSLAMPMRYGLICASFLLMLTVIPTLYSGVPLFGDANLADENNANIDSEFADSDEDNRLVVPFASPLQKGEIPQTGVDDLALNKNDSIYVNTLKSEPTLHLNPNPDNNFIKQEWTDSQVEEYLGCKPIYEIVPSAFVRCSMYENVDLTATPNAIYLNQDKTVAYDSFAFYFSAYQFPEVVPQKGFQLSLAKDKLPLDSTIPSSADDKVSTFDGYAVKLYYFTSDEDIDAQTDSSSEVYIAEFIHEAVGYRIYAYNLTKQDLLDVISLVIK